jgi:hypothetical protein
MGYRQRERKRRRRVATYAAQQEARKSGSSARKWWLTIVVRTTCCARCAGILREGREMIYRATPREALCLACAQSGDVKWRPSAAWERRRRGSR